MFTKVIQPIRSMEDRAHYICCKKRIGSSDRVHDPIQQTVTEDGSTFLKCIICKRRDRSAIGWMCNCEYDYIKTLVRSPDALVNRSLSSRHKVCCTKKPNGCYVPTLTFVTDPGHWECVVCECEQDNITPSDTFVICECEVARRDKLLRELRGSVAKL